MSAPYLQFDHEKIGKRIITNKGCVVGRGESCNVRINHKGVSSRHAEIVNRDGTYWIRDLDSTNGTHVDGSRCHDQIPLNNGSRVSFGRFAATFVVPQPVHSAPKSTVERVAPSTRTTRKKQASINPLWAGVALVACCGLTILVIDRMKAKEQEQVAANDAADAEKEAPKKNKPRDPKSPFSSLGKLDEEVPEYEEDDYDYPTNEKTEQKTTKGTEKRVVAEVEKETTKTEKKALPPTEDPLELALRSGNALEIAKVVRRTKSARAKEIRDRLGDERIYCLHRSGLLGGGGEEVLLSAFGFHCAPGEKKEIIDLVPGCRIEEWKLTIRFTQDYSRGLGRTMGKYRMPPHPKTVTVELVPIHAPGKAWKIEVSTPKKEVPQQGFSEEEVWAMTLDPLLAQLRQQLQ